jgi:hypothetical protein
MDDNNIPGNVLLIDRGVEFASKQKLNSHTSSYRPYEPDMVDLIESNSLIYPSLVQTGCPHNITNKDEYRLCITLVLSDLISKKRLTMYEAQSRLSKFIIN